MRKFLGLLCKMVDRISRRHHASSTVAGGGPAIHNQIDLGGGPILTAPEAFTAGQWTLVDKPSALGDTLTIDITALPADGGSAITSIQFRRDDGAWSTISGVGTGERDITVLVETEADIEIRAINAIGASAVSDTKTETPSLTGGTGVSDQTAQWGDLTPSGEGGFQPFNASNVPVALTAVTDQNGSTRTGSITDGRLVLDGLPVDGDVFTCSHAGGSVDITVATISGYSAVTRDTLRTALIAVRDAAAPGTVYARYKDDWNMGGVDQNDDANNHAFHNIRFTETTRGTVDKHPNEPKPIIYNSMVRCTKSQYLTIKNLAFFIDDDTYAGGGQLLSSGPSSTGTDRTSHIYLEDLDFYGPDISNADLQDATEWPAGYDGALTNGFKMHGNWHGHYKNITIKNCYSACDIGLVGAIVIDNIETQYSYFDNMRFTGNPDPSTYTDTDLKVIKNCGNWAMFAINNELDGELAPHNDAFSGVSGTMRNVLMMHCYTERGDFRGNVMQSTHMDGVWENIVFHENLMIQRGVAWGINPNTVRGMVVNQCTYSSPNNGTTQFRFGSTGGDGLFREALVNKTALLNATTGTYVYSDQIGTGDEAGYITIQDSFVSDTTAIVHLEQFVGPLVTTALTSILASYTPVVASMLDTSGRGALDTSGNWRDTDVPPMIEYDDLPAVLAITGGFNVTPPPEMVHDDYTAATTWTVFYRADGDTVWTEGTTQAVAVTDIDVAGLAADDYLVAVRYSNGSPGVRSGAQTVTVAGAVSDPNGTITSVKTSDASSSTANRRYTLTGALEADEAMSIGDEFLVFPFSYAMDNTGNFNNVDSISSRLASTNIETFTQLTAQDFSGGGGVDSVFGISSLVTTEDTAEDIYVDTVARYAVEMGAAFKLDGVTLTGAIYTAARNDADKSETTTLTAVPADAGIFGAAFFTDRTTAPAISGWTLIESYGVTSATSVDVTFALYRKDAHATTGDVTFLATGSDGVLAIACPTV